MKKLSKAGLTLAALGGVAYAGKRLYDEFNGKEKVMNILDFFKKLAKRGMDGSVRESLTNIREAVNPYADVPAERRPLVKRIMKMIPADELEDEYTPKDISDMFDSEAGGELYNKLQNYSFEANKDFAEMSDSELLSAITHALIDIADPETKMDIMLQAAEEVLLDESEDYDEEIEGLCWDEDYEDYD